jgi:hypothetical protein
LAGGAEGVLGAAGFGAWGFATAATVVAGDAAGGGTFWCMGFCLPYCRSSG